MGDLHGAKLLAGVGEVHVRVSLEVAGLVALAAYLLQPRSR